MGNFLSFCVHRKPAPPPPVPLNAYSLMFAHKYCDPSKLLPLTPGAEDFVHERVREFASLNSMKKEKMLDRIEHAPINLVVSRWVVAQPGGSWGFLDVLLAQVW